MLEEILRLERDLFFTLNGSDSTFWDHFMYLYSYMYIWVPFYVCFLIVVAYQKNWKEIVWTYLIVAVLILLCDQISSGVCKPFFHRFRPTHHPDFMNEVSTVFDYLGGRYGFISGHSTNAFGFAMLTALMFRNKIFTCTIFIYAIVTGYSRIYLGVHFISDVIAGMLVGLLIGYIVYLLYEWGRRRLLGQYGKERSKSRYTKQQAWFLAAVYWVMVIVVLIFNNQLVKPFQ